MIIQSHRYLDDCQLKVMFHQSILKASIFDNDDLIIDFPNVEDFK